MDVDIKSGDIQEEYEIMAIDNIYNLDNIYDINRNRGKIQEIIKRSIDIVAAIIGIILLIPITFRNIYSKKNNERRRTDFL